MESRTPGGHPLRRFVLRTLISMAGLILLAVLVLVGLLIWQRYRDHAPLLRADVPSPDGRIQALLQSDDGAPYHQFYVVRLKPKDGRSVEVARFEGLARNADHDDGADLVWVNNNTLEIRYLSASEPYLEKSQVILGGAPRGIRLVNGWLGNGPQPGRIVEPPQRQPPCPFYSILCR